MLFYFAAPYISKYDILTIYERPSGPIARVGPNTVLTSSAEFWESVNVKPGYKRSKWFYHAARFDWRRDNCFTMIDVEQHDARRKKMAPGVSYILCFCPLD